MGVARREDTARTDTVSLGQGIWWQSPLFRSQVSFSLPARGPLNFWTPPKHTPKAHLFWAALSWIGTAVGSRVFGEGCRAQVRVGNLGLGSQAGCPWGHMHRPAG